MSSRSTIYEPKPLIIAERYTFNQRNQRSGESVAEYVAELRRLAYTCKFGTFLDDALRDRLVCGLRSDSARRRLLADAEGEISLAKAIEHAQRDELAEQNLRALKDCDAALKKFSPANLTADTRHRENLATDAVGGTMQLRTADSLMLLAITATKRTHSACLPKEEERKWQEH